MTNHLNLDDTRSYLDAAQHILTRYTTQGAEANTTAAIRDFFIEVGLVRQEDTNQEAHPAEGSTKAADLGISDRHLFFEVKPRIGTGGDSSKPAPGNIKQIDNYIRIAGRRVSAFSLTASIGFFAPLGTSRTRYAESHTGSPSNLPDSGMRSTSGFGTMCSLCHNSGLARWRASESDSARGRLPTTAIWPQSLAFTTPTRTSLLSR